MNLPTQPRRKKNPLASFGRHLRDALIRAFPIEMRSEHGLIVRMRNRSELSVYHNIFVERVYPFDLYKQAAGPTDSPVVFDVGANTGMFAAAIFDHWPGAHVHSFEPQKKLIPRIKEMAVINGLEDRLEVNWCAVSGSSGEAEFFQNRNPISASLLKAKAARRTIRRVDRVPVTTLDEYAAGRDIPRVHILKLDVEGVELEALSGARQVLQRVGLVFIEVHPPFSTFSAAKHLLEKAGLVCLNPTPAPDDTVQANCVFARRQ